MGNYFIHIPRTGGNSIGGVIPPKYFKYVGHDLRSANYIHPKNICKPSDYCFTIVRNPYDRLISAFCYLKTGGMTQQDAYDAYMIGANVLSFREFIRIRLHEVIYWQIHFIPQTFFIQDIPNIKTYRYEFFEQSFADICKSLGVNNIGLPKTPKNQSERENKIKAYFDYDTLKIVKKLYKQDFRLLGYSDKL